MSRTAPSRFVVTGARITENLLHHKREDVRRILEDKGFAEGPGDDDDTCIFSKEGTPDGSRHTEIVFDEAGFVLADGGVRFSG